MRHPNALRAFIRHAYLTPFAASLIVAVAPPVEAASNFRLDASNTAFDLPAPLFQTSTVSGLLTLASTVAPGGSFNQADIIGFTFDFGGITVTSAETMLSGGDITAFGSLAAGGAWISLLDLRYDLPQTVVPCSLVCEADRDRHFR
jgi:hypothetical protein